MGPTMKLESILQYVDAYLGIAGFPDYPDAFNGLQVEGPEEITRIAAAVDASEATIASAADQGCDLLIVHHGLFWDGQRTVTGRRFRRLSTLLRNGIALYAAHLPLDAHHEVGNCALLARALGIDIQGGFGAFQGVEVGCMGNASESRESLRDKLAEVVQGEVRLIAGGPEEIERVAVVTGGWRLLDRRGRAGGRRCLRHRRGCASHVLRRHGTRRERILRWALRHGDVWSSRASRPPGGAVPAPLDLHRPPDWTLVRLSHENGLLEQAVR